MPLERLGKYERLDVLGHGASGIVYLAKDTLLGKQVALKEISAQGDEKERFLEEARVLDRLRHPNIVRVNSVDEIAGRVVIDMEYVRGRTLQDILRETPALPVAEAVSVAAQLCDGLAYAHSMRTVHRDIKPANILLTSDGAVKIVDFGLAEVLGTHSFAGGAGTYAYMAPEDFHPEEQSDRQADIWAVGVVLYEMLAGRRPFQVIKAKDPFAWKTAIESEPIVPLSALRPDVPPGLEGIVGRALARPKAERYRDAGEMAADLRALGLGTARTTGTESAGLLRKKVEATEEQNEDGDLPTVAGLRTVAVAPVLAGFPPNMTDIEAFLALAPDRWEAASDALADGTLAAWLRAAGEGPLAAVAADLAAETGRNPDDMLRDCLYRAGLETADEARLAYAEARQLLEIGRRADAARLLRRAAHLDPSRPEYAAEPSLADTVPAEVSEANALIVSADAVHFGTIRRGKSRSRRITLSSPNGRLEGRVVAAPGWVRVEPSAFAAKKRQTLTLTTDTDSVWSVPAEFADTVTLETSAGRRTVAVTAHILPARPGWTKIIFWYLPLLLSASLPVGVSFYARTSHPPLHGVQQPGFAASGLLLLSLFALGWAADIAWVPRFLPLALSGFVFWRLSAMLGYGTARSHLLLMQAVTPVVVLLVLQTITALLDPTRWGNWKIWRWIAAAVGALVGYSLLHSG